MYACKIRGVPGEPAIPEGRDYPEGFLVPPGSPEVTSDSLSKNSMHRPISHVVRAEKLLPSPHLR